MTYEENETHLHLDYARDEVNFYTTRRGEASKLMNRLEPAEEEYDLRRVRNGDGDFWDFTVPAEFFTDYFATAAKSKRWVEKTKERCSEA